MKNTIFFQVREVYRSVIVFVFLFTVFSFSIQSCKTHKAINRTVILFPQPPDQPRFQYLTSFSNSSNIMKQRGGLKKSVLGEDKIFTIGKPYGLTTSNGKVYIVDGTIAGVEIIDLAKHKYIPFTPSGRGALRTPINCCLDEDNNLYVTDGQRNEVVIFNNKHEYIGTIGSSDSIGDLRPLDVCIAEGKIFVSNAKQQNVQVYDRLTHKLLYKIPERDSGTTRILYSPINLCIRDNFLYVTDFGDFKIKKFTLNGKFINSVGEYGQGLGQFVRPKGIAVDKDYNLFVVDAGFENIQIFNSQNKLLMFFGGPYKGPGDMWLPAKVHIDYENIEYYKKFVAPDLEVKYLIFVTNQYGPDKVSVYAAVQPKK